MGCLRARNLDSRDPVRLCDVVYRRISSRGIKIFANTVARKSTAVEMESIKNVSPSEIRWEGSRSGEWTNWPGTKDKA
jgi:hypothetical protein